MTGLDTNVLVRYLVEDDADQTAQAAARIEGAADRGERLFVSHVVVCEVVWVLQAAYKTARAEVIVAIKGLIRARQLRFEQSELLHRALAAFEVGEGDFADYVIRERCISSGCDQVATFDKKLLKEGGFIQP